MRIVAVLLVSFLPVAFVSGQAPVRAPMDDKIEVRRLDRLLVASSWTSTECSLEQSSLECVSGGAAVQFHVPVDFAAGEPSYPIGWPRIACALKGAEGDWSQWDSFELEIMARYSGKKLPKQAVSLLIGQRPKEFILPLEFPEQDKWLSVRILLASVKDAGVPIDAVSHVRFSVSESDYQDKDIVDFHIGAFRLTRATACEVVEFGCPDQVVFQGQSSVKLNMTVVGPPAEMRRGVPFTLRGKDGVIRRETLPLGRGRQLYACDISELRLPPGDYELVVFADDEAKRKMVALKVVEDPWKEE